MILQALVEYYQRKAANPESDISPQGFEDKELAFIIQIDIEGRFLQIRDTRENSKSKKAVGRIFRVPQSVKRASGIKANYLWDNPEYALGIAEEGKDLQKKHQAFLDNIKTRYPNLLQNAEFQAVIRFLKSDFLAELQQDPCWSDLIKGAVNVSFEVIGGHGGLVCQHPDVIAAIEAPIDINGNICLITGEKSPIARLHHSIKGVRGAQSSGGNIVSYNFDAAESYHKKQGDNAPIGEYACFAYTTALNHLLKSSQKVVYGEATTIVFWAAKNNHPFESLLSHLIEVAPKDDPDRNTNAVRSLYKSPFHKINAFDEDDTVFHLLGISPNASRLAISFFWTTTISELAHNLIAHFDDVNITGKKEHFSVYELISSVLLQGDLKNLPTNLMVRYLKAIFEGGLYPHQLLPMAIQRLNDNEGISQRRAAIIKSWVNRYTRKVQQHEKEVHVSLDQSNTNIGYLLGRLFAILEKIQEESQGGREINSTIRDRFYAAASTRPVTAFPQLMRLKNHHLAKLENKGRVVNLEKKITEVMEAIAKFPPILSLTDQGRFAIGYYHQRQDFFNKQDKN